jgi:demethylmenaquinone methyltransferase/2-methoxy-6-polyprenyl-1,4-benzoquinol methylase
MINLAQKVGQKFVNSVFKDVHTKYDQANDAMSLFLHRKWKKDFVSMLNINESSKVLDLASGTGDIAKLLLKKTRNVTLCDINEDMLTIAKKKINGGEFVLADAQKLPFENKSFDLVTCVFGIRNFQEIEKSIGEVRRVLTTGGKFAIMEFMPNAESSTINVLYRAYIKHILPKYDSLFTNSSNSYSYLSQSILEFQDREKFITLLENNGFSIVSPSIMNSTVGIFLCEKK